MWQSECFGKRGGKKFEWLVIGKRYKKELEYSVDKMNALGEEGEKIV